MVIRGRNSKKAETTMAIKEKDTQTKIGRHNTVGNLKIEQYNYY